MQPLQLFYGCICTQGSQEVGAYDNNRHHHHHQQQQQQGTNSGYCSVVWWLYTGCSRKG